MREVFVLDPGVSSGYLRACVHDDSSVEILELKQWKPSDWRHVVKFVLTELYKASTGAPEFVYERFDLRPGNKFLADLTPVKINSAIEYALLTETALRGVKAVAQTPAQAKGLASDKVLKALGWWPTGKTVGQPDADDARDALRHLVHYEVKTMRNRWVAEHGWG